MSGDVVGAILAPGADVRAWAPGVVLSIDNTGARLTVDLGDGVPVVLRRVAAPYRVGDTVAVVRDPGRSGAGQVVVGVVSAPAPAWSWGEVTAVDGGSARLTVTVDGVSYVLPHVAGTYAVTDQVAVLLDHTSGLGGLVVGKMGNPPSNPSVPVVPATVAAPTTRTVGPVAITPSWSGTYRVSRAAWDRWNTGSYGGRSDCYQGTDSTGSGGQLIGLVTFGDKLVNLGATSITAAVVTLRSNGAGYTTAPTFTVQGSPHGSRPTGSPSTTGTTATSAAIARVGGRTTLALPSDIREGMRTGAIKGLVIVGSTYAGLFGTSRADGLALAITYTKPI